MAGNNYLSGIPQSLLRIIQFLYSLNLKDATDLMKAIVHLWREYYVLIKIRPIVKEYVVSFEYKKETLMNCKVKSIKEILDIVREMQFSRGERYFD